MCGRFESLTKENIIKINLNEEDLSKIKYGDVFPTNYSIVYANNNYQVMKWGIKKWNSSGSIINARQETLLDKPFFKQDYQTHRCIIIGRGFYEWNSNKDKYLVKSTNTKFTYMAGLYKEVEGIKQYVIITQPATKEFSVLHHRLPLMLNDDQVSSYLKGDNLETWLYPKYDVNISWIANNE